MTDQLQPPVESATPKTRRARYGGPIVSQKPQRSTIVYVDGFNFYYGALRDHPELKWLDYRKLAERLLRGHDIQTVKYFTSHVQDRADDPGLAQRRGAYISALTEHSKIEVYLGQFKQRERWLPQARGHRRGNIEMVRVIYTEEKRSDVSLGAHLVRDACHRKMDVALVLSNDSDLQTPVKMAEEEDVLVITVNPHEHEDQPRRLLSADRRTQSQLPNPVVFGAGRKIYRPKEWELGAQEPAEAGSCWA